MAFDDYDVVIPLDYGDHLCIDCARALMPEHPEWTDPEADDSNMTPIFETTQVPYLLTCGRCGHISTIGSFGGEAVDYGLDILREHLRNGTHTEYADVYADRLAACNLGDRWEGVRAELILDRYRTLRKAHS